MNDVAWHTIEEPEKRMTIEIPVWLVHTIAWIGLGIIGILAMFGIVLLYGLTRK